MKVQVTAIRKPAKKVEVTLIKPRPIRVTASVCSRTEPELAAEQPAELVSAPCEPVEPEKDESCCAGIAEEPAAESDCTDADDALCDEPGDESAEADDEQNVDELFDEVEDLFNDAIDDAQDAAAALGAQDSEPDEESVFGIADDGGEDSSPAMFSQPVDIDGDGVPDKGVYCRYFGRDTDGNKVEVNQSQATGREVVSFDEGSGRLSRICGIIKHPPEDE